MTSNTEWTWREGPIDQTEEHFELLFWPDKWGDRPQPLALVGRDRDSGLIVQFLDDAAGFAENRDKLIEALDFYAAYDAPVDKWSYLVRRATSGTANIYADVTWIHIPKGHTA